MQKRKVGFWIAGSFVLLVGILVIIGWIFEIEFLMSIVPGYESMKVNTALAFVTASVAFLGLRNRAKANNRILLISGGSLTLLLGLTVMAQYIFKTDLKVDEAFFVDEGARLRNSPYPGRMAPSTALSFILMGIGFLLSVMPLKWARISGQFFFHVCLAISTVALLGYIYIIPSFQKLSFLVSMALHTSISFFLLSVGAVFTDERWGLGGLFLSNKVGSTMAKRLFPYLMASVVILGGIGIFIFRRGWLSADLGVALFVIMFLFIGVFLIWDTATRLNLIDSERHTAEEEIRRLNKDLELKVEKRTRALKQLSDRLKVATSATKIGIWELEISSGIVKLDETLVDLYQLPSGKSNITLREWLDLIHPEDSLRVEQRIDKVIRQGKEFETEFRVLNGQEQVRYLIARAVIQKDPNSGQAIRMVGTNWDVSDQKKAELELQKSNERNKIFVQQAPHAIAMFDRNMRYMAASTQWVKDYGLEGKQLIGKSHYEIFPEIGDEWKKIHQECLQGAINQCDEAYFEREDGSYQYIKWDVRPWYLAEDNIGGILMYTADITYIKEKEKEKRHIEEILNRTKEIARIGAWELDLQKNHLTWSKVTREIHGVSPDYNPTLEEALTFYREGNSRDRIQELVNRAISEGEKFDEELQIVTQKGEVKWIRAIGQPDFFKDKCIRLYGLFQDIDQSRRMREQLEIVNQELRAILDAGTRVSIISTDTEGIITHFSKGAETLLGYSHGEMVGRESPALIHDEGEVIQRGEELSQLYGREIRGFDVFVESARQGSYENREWTYVRKDGSRFPVQLMVSGIRNSENQLTGFLGIAVDISEIKEKEKSIQEANEKLETLAHRLTTQNQQLANFAHITSHNLRSPVSNLLALLNLYHQSENLEEKEMLFPKFESVIHHLSDTLNHLVEALRIQEDANKEREMVNLQEIFNKTAEVLTAQIMMTKAEIEADFSRLNQIYYNRGYLESIFLNLLSNALKYRSPDRNPRIKIWSEEINGEAKLYVSDNGLGINLKRHGHKLFGLHKTFHRHDEAKGVGLYLTKTQIEALGGGISAKSEVDKGTEFEITFNKKE